MRTWIHKRRPTGAAKRGRRPSLEQLETRLVPSLAPSVLGAADPTFGKGGQVAATFGHPDEAITALAVNPTSSDIIAVGATSESMSAGPAALEVLDYSMYGGQAKPKFAKAISFDVGGKLVSFSKGDDFPNGVAVQSDGKALIAGVADISVAFVARLNADGSADTSFGPNGDGVVTIPLAGGVLSAHGVAYDAATGHVALALTAQTAAGYGVEAAVLDGSGRLLTPIAPTTLSPTAAAANGIAFQADGKIVMVGSYAGAQGSHSFVARYNADGSADAGFGSAGRLALDFPGRADSELRSVLVQPGGRIVAGGWSVGSSGNSDFTLVGLTPAGRLDPTFGSGGVVITSFVENSLIDALAQDSAGYIVAAGHAGLLGGPGLTPTSDAAAARYTANGSLDLNYGSGGKFLNGGVLSVQPSIAFAVAAQPDGQIVLGGGSLTPTGGASNLLMRQNGYLAAMLNQAYQDVDGHAASTAEEAAALKPLGKGANFGSLVLKTVENSKESRTLRVDNWFMRYGLLPDTLTQNADIAMLATKPDHAVQLTILTSAAYVAKYGATGTSYVTSLYTNLLGRAPDAGGLAFWVGQLALHGRSYVADQFLYSKEYLTDLVTADYLNVLNRAPDPSGLAFWVGELTWQPAKPGKPAGPAMTPEQVIATMMDTSPNVSEFEKLVG